MFITIFVRIKENLIMFRAICTAVFLCFFQILAFSQVKSIEGYVFETGNRGYIQSVKVQLIAADGVEVLDTDFTNNEGFFSFEVNQIANYEISIAKDRYENQVTSIKKADLQTQDKVFVNLKMKRAPGYQFEITLAPKRDSEDVAVQAIEGALIEVYNNTTRKSEMVLNDHPDPHFDVDLLKGNHYTVLVRKEGYLAKRMEAFVDVEGCILCFEGIGSVTPGVADNLTGGNQMGVLLANVELERAFSGKKMEVQDIYYDFGSAKLRREAYEELDKVAILIKDNPGVTIELGSHTDSRGGKEKNQSLSVKRAKSAVRYLIEEGGVPAINIIARGYGESEIKNGCVDGVECSETKHQENRRTELKITGIMAAPPARVSLERMKQIENMDDIIAELQSEGQVRVEEGQTIDDIIKETEQPKSKVEPQDLSDDELNDAVDKIFAQATKKIETGEIENVSKETIELQGDSQAIDAAAEQDKVPEMDKPETVNDNPYSYINGPKIVILESDLLLKSDHPIFQKHDQIFQYMQNDEVLYMIGDFKDMDKAEGFLNTTKLMYPDAYILNFNKGVIIN